MAKNWFTEADNIKLRHHYNNQFNEEKKPLTDKEIEERKKQHPECDTPEKECRCWEFFNYRN